jgi:phosphatidylserine/phosphatidylglycerophosphate/cardiolipin synthase-like enzyme
MNVDSDRQPGVAADTNKSSRWIQLLFVLCVAVAVGFLLRYYTGKPQETADRTWDVYFSGVSTAPIDKNTPYSLDKRLVARLADAAMQIDAALYRLDSAPIADALIEAHHRGVKVRVVTETDNVDEAAIERLQEVGISVADDDDHDGLMHHKFIVIDERYVWTGSYNTTYNGAYRNNNNVIFIDSVPLAYNFTQEFRDLFLDPQGKKSAGAFIAYPKIALADGMQIFTYFSPGNDTISPLLKEINAAEKSIHFMAFAFTHDMLGNAMRDRFASGVDVRGVFEKRQTDNPYSEYEAMKKAGLPVVLDSNRGDMHHKVIVIDAETVITGSYNFSKNAEKRNDENLLIIKGNREIAAAYLAEFEKITR